MAKPWEKRQQKDGPWKSRQKKPKDKNDQFTMSLGVEPSEDQTIVKPAPELKEWQGVGVGRCGVGSCVESSCQFASMFVDMKLLVR